MLHDHRLYRESAVSPAPAGGAGSMGHNGGPPLEDPPVNDLFTRWRWRKVYREARKNPPHSIMMFRLQRARAAGVSYEEYMLELLDTGRHLQASDLAEGSEYRKRRSY